MTYQLSLLLSFIHSFLFFSIFIRITAVGAELDRQNLKVNILRKFVARELQFLCLDRVVS